jgi:hypothetical protein
LGRQPKSRFDKVAPEFTDAPLKANMFTIIYLSGFLRCNLVLAATACCLELPNGQPAWRFRGPGAVPTVFTRYRQHASEIFSHVILAILCKPSKAFPLL